MRLIVPYAPPPMTRYHQTTIDDTITSPSYNSDLPAGWIDLVDAASGKRIFLQKETNSIAFCYKDILKKSPSKPSQTQKPTQSQPTQSSPPPRRQRRHQYPGANVVSPRVARIDLSVMDEDEESSSGSDGEIDISIAQLRQRARRDDGIPSQIDVDEVDESDNNEETQSVSEGVEDHQAVEYIRDDDDDDVD
jgi:hypothetical protein